MDYHIEVETGKTWVRIASFFRIEDMQDCLKTMRDNNSGCVYQPVAESE